MTTTPAAATYNTSIVSHDNKDEDLFHLAMQKVQYLDAVLKPDSDVPVSEIFDRRKEARDALKNFGES